jgi:MSHA pilin protein MshD
MRTQHKQRGISLIELIMFIVIMSIGLTGSMLAINQMTQSNPNTLLRKEVVTVAESLLEQIEAQPFSNITNATMVTLINNALPASGVTGASAVLSLGGTSAVSITVTASGVTGQTYSLTGYRTYHF